MTPNIPDRSEQPVTSFEVDDLQEFTCEAITDPEELAKLARTRGPDLLFEADMEMDFVCEAITDPAVLATIPPSKGRRGAA